MSDDNEDITKLKERVAVLERLAVGHHEAMQQLLGIVQSLGKANEAMLKAMSEMTKSTSWW